MSLIIQNKNAQVFFEYFGLAVFGYLTLKYLIKIASNLYTFTLGSPNLKKYGDWAVVTGCTDGIGKAYTYKLAKKGLNVVLISRSADKLKELSNDLVEKYKIQTRIISADFTEENTIYDEIKRQIEDLNIGVLINNVGMGYAHPEFFAELPDLNQFINNLIHCNIISVTKMTAIVLPGMVKRGGGIIVNNASSSGRFPTPLLTVYSATKAYVDFFSRALQVEYKSKRITIQSLCPFFVSTKLSKTRRSLMSPNPDEYVSSSIKTIGSQSATNGCLVHNIQGWALEDIIPESIRDNILLKQLIQAKGAALRRINREKQAKKE